MASGCNGANLAYAEVLTCGQDGQEPSLLLSIERRATYGTATTVLRRYLFDAPEDIVRFCGTHKLKLSSLAGVFFSCGRGAAGLPELVLAAAEQGLSKLHVRGPVGVVHFTKTVLETLSNPRSVDVLPGEATPGPQPLCYEDEYVTITAVAPSRVDHSEGSPQKRQRVGSVGYSCKLRFGGAELIVFPTGEKASPWRCMGDNQPFVFYLGRAPSGAEGHEVGISNRGRRRELWKSREQFHRWRTLFPGLTLPDCPIVSEQERGFNAGEDQAPVLRAYLFPKKQLESGNEENIDYKAIDEELSKEFQEWDLSTALDEAKDRLISAASACKVGDPELLFLGTGSAKPSSRRGQSSILFKLDKFTALLDCGGGSWAQLKRLLGEASARSVVDSLDVIWISHHHADHCAGLPSILAQRSKPGIRVFGSQRVLRFWRASLEFAGCGCGGAMAAPSICAHKEIHNQQRSIALCPNWPETFRSVPVPHCPESYALVLRAGETQFVYSGDCRPSDELVKITEEASAEGVRTWLVHEATFDADEVANAIAAKHSTIPEALDVAMRMGATGVLLTHFSQRYASIGFNPEGASANTAPSKLKQEETAKKSLCRGTNPKELVASLAAGAAFDGLHIRAAQMDAFGAARPIFEQYWAKRHEKSELKKRTEMPLERQPHPGAIIPRACFRGEFVDAASPAPLVSKPTSVEHIDPAPSSGSGAKVAPSPKPKTIPMALGARLRLFYLQVNPEKVSDAPGVARLFVGREADLNVKLHSRYGKDLQTEGLLAPESSSSSSEASDGESDDKNNKPPKVSKALKSVVDSCAEVIPMLPTPPPSFLLQEPIKIPTLVNGERHPSSSIPRPPPVPQAKKVNANVTNVKDSRVEPVDPPASASTTLSHLLPAPLAPPVSTQLPPPPLPPASNLPASTRTLPTPPAAPRPITTAQVQNVIDDEDDCFKFRMKPKRVEETSLAEKLRSFYLQHNPAKVGDADKVARLFACKEDELNAKLRANYAGADLSSCGSLSGSKDEEIPPWLLDDSDSE